MRSAFMPSRIYLKPRPSSPISVSGASFRLSMKTSQVLWLIAASSLRISTPLPTASRRSTRNTETPSLRRFTSSAGVVRASSSIRSDCSARLVHTFWPLTTYWLPSRTARVLSCVVSEPGRRLGHAERLHPQFAASRCPGRYFCFCSSDAVPQHGAHCVHLRMAGGRVAACRMDRFEHSTGCRNWQAGAAEFFRDQASRDSPHRSAPARIRSDTHSHRRASSNRRCRTARRYAQRIREFPASPRRSA